LLAAGTPLTNSVQENFRGFTYHGGESVIASRREYFQERQQANGEEDGEEAQAEDVSEPTTEDELEDTGRSAGRYANARRKNKDLFDDDMS
jgi:hypothetical protein